MIDFRPMTPLDMGKIAARARHWDRVECAAAGLSVKHALRKGMALGEATAVVVDGQTVGAFGAYPVSLVAGRACVWGLFTDEATRHARRFVDLAPLILETLLDRYLVLENAVCEGNTSAIRWLQFAGFEVAPAETRADGYRFRRIKLCANPQP